jgi:hypothetical protein
VKTPVDREGCCRLRKHQTSRGEMRMGIPTTVASASSKAPVQTGIFKWLPLSNTNKRKQNERR